MAQPLPQTDPTVKVPAAVLAAAARANEVHKSIYDPNSAPEPEAKEPEPEAVAPEAAPPAPEPRKPEPEVTPPGNKARNWESDYKAMKGRFDQAESRIRDLVGHIDTLNATIANLQDRIASMETAPPELRAERLVTPDEEADYGTELLTVVGKKAREELSPEVQQLKNQISRLEARLGDVSQVATVSAREKLHETLTQEVPTWKELNVNPEFLAWLALPDAYSGAIRSEMLKDAYGRNDSARVVAFFKGFLAEEAAVAPQGSSTGQGAQTTAPKPSLETYAAPGRAKTAAATQSPPEKPTITRAFISQHYADSAAGRYRGREADYQKTEALIQAAMREGRIQ